MTEDEIIAQLITADENRIRAVLGRHRAGLEAILHDDLVYTHSSGSEENKPTYIDRVVSGAYDYRSFVQKRRAFRLTGEFAFMNGENEVDIVRDGQLHRLAGRYQMAWRADAQDWRLFSFAAAPLPRT